MFFPRQTDLRPNRSTFNQVCYLSQFTSNGFQNRESRIIRNLKGVVRGSALGPFFLSLFLIFLLHFDPPLAELFILTALASGFSSILNLLLKRPFRERWFDWSALLCSGVFLLTRANEKHSFFVRSPSG